MIVLDTNVLSELMRPEPDTLVLAWANGLDPEDIAITAMNEAEILHGIALLPTGRRQQALRESWEELSTPGPQIRPTPPDRWPSPASTTRQRR